MLSCRLSRKSVNLQNTRQFSWNNLRIISNKLQRSEITSSQNDSKAETENVIKHHRIRSNTKIFTLFKNKIGSRIHIPAAAGLVLNLDTNQSDNVTDSTVVDQLVNKSDTVSNEKATDPIINKNAETVNITEVSEETAAASVKVEDITEVLPEPPAALDISEIAAEAIQQINILGDPTFASLGLCGNTPVGVVQMCFEYLSVTCGIPWWGAICIGTAVIRVCMFPLVILAQRNAARMNNNLPQMQAIQLKMTEARQTGNQLEVARYSQELMLFMKEKKLNPLKNMIVPLCQMPVFISFFMALRQMCNVPVESLRTGGLWWFTDLTLPDQFFIMPIVTSLTLWATIELGTDAAKLSAQNLQTMKYVLRAMPVCILPFTMGFPGAILVYWTSSNFISLAQVGILKIPAVREYCKIEKAVEFDPQTLPIKPKGFTEGLKDSWTNMKIVSELEERKRLDEIQFRRAGKGPIVKTYKYDPTKQTTHIPAAIQAKKK